MESSRIRKTNMEQSIGYVHSHRYIHRSGITLTTDKEVDNTDYLIIMASVRGWDLLGSKWKCCPRHVLKVELLAVMCWPVGILVVPDWLRFSLPIALWCPLSLHLFPSGGHTWAVLQLPEDVQREDLAEASLAQEPRHKLTLGGGGDSYLLLCHRSGCNFISLLLYLYNCMW